MSAAGRIIMRECGAGREFVAMIPALRHPNRVSERERQTRKAERSMQRYVSISVRFTKLACNPFADPAELSIVRIARSKRATVAYGRINKLARGGR